MPPLKHVSRDEALPLSFAQQRLWFLAQLEPENAFYNSPLAVRLKGELKVTALKQTLGELMKRHEVLRTSFVVEQGKPRQVIGVVEAPLTIIELDDLEESEREAAVRELAVREASQPFDLSQSPLLRVKLVRLSEQEHMLLLTMHHIVSDGWSMGVLIREVSELYSAYASGREPQLEELPIQYADYASWQREWLQGEVLEEQVQYWREQLTGAPQVLELPTDRVRPTVQSYRGAQEQIALSEEVSAALKDLSRREGVTIFMLLLAAFQVLLMRYSGQEDVVVGTPIAGRRHKEVEGLIGCFINQLVLRTDLSGNPSFRDLLARVREVCLGAYSHQDLPFEKLVEELQPERNLSHSPLFQVNFAVQNTPRQMLTLPGLELASINVHSDAAKHDLTLAMGETATGIGGSLGYNSDLFDASTIVRLLQHLETLLTDVAHSPDRAIWDLQLLSKTEEQTLITDWNNTRVAPQPEFASHELFEEQASRDPDAVVMVYEGHHLTNSALNARANQVAHYLRRQGVRPETRVAILADCSPEMVIAMLATLKAGAAYVGLDSRLPAERLSFMLDDAGPSVLLAQKQFAETLQHDAICLDSDWDLFATESEDNLESSTTPGNMACLIYTSGSTGRPKGAAGEHRHILGYVDGIVERLTLAPGKSFAMHQTLAVDAPVTFLYACLCRGGVLHLLSRERVSNADALSAYFADEQIDYFKVAPSHFRSLLTAARPEQVLPLDLILLGGEALTQDLVSRIQDLNPECRIVNHYGPTETTCGVTTKEVVSKTGSPTVALGRPLADAEIFLLDRYLKPVPIGVAGELYIGGRTVTRGYFGRPELTAQRFIPHPFSDQNGARLYRTGDLARYLPDGDIEFLGRIDNQVKVRGFRIELEEIEVALSEHPSVESAAVVAIDHGNGDKRLVAYVVTSKTVTVTASDLHEFIQQKLPDYMVPSLFIMLDEIPRTPQGKVDRKALPVPDRARPELDERLVLPSTENEKMLADIWMSLLHLDQMGVHDNFFDLGGHSLLATQLVSQIRETFQVEMPLYTVFEKPTISKLAIAVEDLRNTGKTQTSFIKKLPREAHRVKRASLHLEN